MITDANGMPVLQPLVDDASTATFNAAFAQIGTTIGTTINNQRPIKTYRWANNAARVAQAGMTGGDLGYQVDTDTTYQYTGSAWVLRLQDTGWVNVTLATGFLPDTPVPAARLIHGVVYLRGHVLGDVATGDPVVIGNLAPRFRPSSNMWFPLLGQNDNRGGRLLVSTNGDIAADVSPAGVISATALENVIYPKD